MGPRPGRRTPAPRGVRGRDLIETTASGTGHPGDRAAGSPPAGDTPAVGEPADAAVHGAPLRSVLRVTSFRRLWVALAMSSLGDWLGLLATTALAADLAGSYTTANFALGGVLVFRLLPALLLGPLAGVFADRFDRRTTMVVCDLIRFGLFASIPLVRSLAWLLVASFLIEAVSLFWIPAKEATVPNLLNRDQLEPANQLSLVTTYGFTPVIAAGLFSSLAVVSRLLADHVDLRFFEANPVDLALYFNAASFLFSALTVARLTAIGTGADRDGRPASAPSLVRSLVDGWRFVGRTALVRGLVIGILGAFATGGAVVGTGKVYAAQLGGGDAAYGVLFGTLFLGLGLGMSLGPRLARDLSRRRLFGLAVLWAGASVSVLALLPHLVPAILLTLSVGAAAGVAYLCGLTLLGAEVADEVRGRTFAFVQSMVRVDLLLTLAAVPFVVGALGRRRIAFGDVGFVLDGVRVLLFVAGLVGVAVGVVAYRQMDDRRGVPLLTDLVAATRRRRPEPAARPPGQGLFVAFEGGEGAGKSTQVQRLADALRGGGHEVVVTREPGSTPLGRGIRALLLDASGPAPSARTEALLYAADRAEHVAAVVRPALARGAVVVSDRYVDSSLAYQGAGRGLGVDAVERLSGWATDGLRPHLTVLLDLTPAEGLSRAARRAAADRLEGEPLDFHDRVRRAFLALAASDPGRYLVVDATRDADDIATDVLARVTARLGSPSAPVAGTPDTGPAPASAGPDPAGPDPTGTAPPAPPVELHR